MHVYCEIQIIRDRNLKHFLNVGSHVGTVALPISKHISRVTAIEAYPKTYASLVRNIELNAIENIRAINVAVGECPGKVYFLDETHERLRTNIGGMAALTETDLIEHRRSAHICTKRIEGVMDSLDAMDDVVDFDIMLIDIEGMEDKLLKGASKKIQMYKPILFIEIWNDAKRRYENMNTRSRDIVNMIVKMGYRLYMHIGDDYVFLPC